MQALKPVHLLVKDEKLRPWQRAMLRAPNRTHLMSVPLSSEVDDVTIYHGFVLFHFTGNADHQRCRKKHQRFLKDQYLIATKPKFIPLSTDPVAR